MTDIELINAILSVVQSGGIIALLLYNQQLGLRGEVVPKAVVSAVVKETVAATFEEFEERGFFTVSSREPSRRVYGEAE